MLAFSLTLSLSLHPSLALFSENGSIHAAWKLMPIAWGVINKLAFEFMSANASV